MTGERHLSSEQLVRVAAKDLDAEQRAAALRHLEVCQDCGDRLAAVLLLRQGRYRRRSVGVLLAAAAIIVLAVAIWALAPASMESGPKPLTPAQQRLAERYAGLVSRENIDPLIWNFILRIDYPDVVQVSPDNRLRDTRAAIIALRDGRYQEAVDRLVELQVANPDFDSIAGWLGVALHLSGETDPLVEELLQRGIDTGIEPLLEMGLWYGAQQRLITGRPEEAASLLGRLAQRKTTIGRMGKAQLERLQADGFGLPEQQNVPRT